MSEFLWTAEEAAAATAGQATDAWNVTGVSIDSRTTESGDLFVALEGPRFDGHEFVSRALDSGASAAMVTRSPPGVRSGAPLLRVADTLAGLAALGAEARQRSRSRIAAVTGSAGKTGTKDALRLALAETGRAHASAASHNNHWGVPLSLARLPRDSAFGVFEVGMNHAGEIAPLSRLARPHVAIVTTVESAHLEFFPSVEAVADAKAEIFEGLEPGGCAVLNRDNPQYARLERAAHKHGATVLGFGAHERADVHLEKCALLADCATVSATVASEPVTYKVGAPGRHWVMNSLAVLAAVHSLGADLGLAALSLARIDPGPGRGRRLTVPVAGGAFEVIDESYNANPASMHAALAVLSRAEVKGRGRRIAVLGDMRELGTDTAALHAGVAMVAEGAGVDLVYAVGPASRALDEALPRALRGGHLATAAEAALKLAAEVQPGDVVLVKGSQGVGMAAVTQALTALAVRERAQPFSADVRGAA